MIKKFIGLCLLVLQSGVLFHRSTFIGVLCGAWAYFGAPGETHIFQRMLTPDLYLFMFAFLLFYRVTLKKVYKTDGDLDLHAMGVCLLGDMAWAIVAMICTVPFFMSFNVADGLSERNTPEMKQLMFLNAQ